MFPPVAQQICFDSGNSVLLKLKHVFRKNFFIFRKIFGERFEVIVKFVFWGPKDQHKRQIKGFDRSLHEHALQDRSNQARIEAGSHSLLLKGFVLMKTGVSNTLLQTLSLIL